MEFDSTMALEEHARQIIAERLAQAARDAQVRQLPRQIRRLPAAGRVPRWAGPALVARPLALFRLWLGQA
jgi:hypothetical protein